MIALNVWCRSPAVPCPCTPTRAIALLALAGIASQAMVRAPDSLLPQSATDIGVTVGAASIIVSAYAITDATVQLVIGPIGDRFGKFRSVGIDLRVSATLHHVDFAREDVDLAVRHGDGNWNGLDVVRLCSEQLFPVCAPKLVSGRNRITKAADLLKLTLLRLDDSNAWTRWLEAAGVNDAVVRGPILNRASMLIDAAIDGQGVALACTALAASDLINGRLIRPVDVSLRMSNTYWIVCPKATSALPKIATFRSWLLAEAADDVQRLKTLEKQKNGELIAPACDALELGDRPAPLVHIHRFVGRFVKRARCRAIVRIKRDSHACGDRQGNARCFDRARDP
jgi:DNA-binding transcriptional LysR family regulator